MLTMQIHESGADGRELGDRRQSAVDVRSAPAVARNNSGQHDLVPACVFETPFDACLHGTSTHEHRVGAPAEEQLDRLDKQRLTGAGLAGDRGETRTDENSQVVDDPEIGDVELVQHRQRSASPNLALRI